MINVIINVGTNMFCEDEIIISDRLNSHQSTTHKPAFPEPTLPKPDLPHTALAHTTLPDKVLLHTALAHTETRSIHELILFGENYISPLWLTGSWTPPELTKVLYPLSTSKNSEYATTLTLPNQALSNCWKLTAPIPRNSTSQSTGQIQITQAS